MDTAIVNNIPEEHATKRGLTRSEMFTEWIEQFRAHATQKCAFNIEPTFVPKSRVRNWKNLYELVKEISPEICSEHEHWLQGFIALQTSR